MDFNTFFRVYYAEFLILLVSVGFAVPIVSLLYCIVMWFLSSLYHPRSLSKQVYGKNVLVTGSSKGLGVAIATELVKAGANVTLVARGKVINGVSTLSSVAKELEQFKVNSDQKITALPIDLTIYDQVVDKLQDHINRNGSFDWVICNAGTALPKLLMDQIPKKGQKGEHEWMMECNYYSAMFVVRALISISKVESCSTLDDDRRLPKRFVFVGSVLSVLSFIGFTGYSASKYALRGFTDALRSELVALGIKVHLYLPGNMDTPGFAEENLGKPKITQEIEGQSVLVSPEAAAKFMLGSILSERYYISNDLLGELARISVNGGAPRANMIAEVLASPLLAAIFTIWTFFTDIQIKSHFKTKKTL